MDPLLSTINHCVGREMILGSRQCWDADTIVRLMSMRVTTRAVQTEQDRVRTVYMITDVLDALPGAQTTVSKHRREECISLSYL